MHRRTVFTSKQGGVKAKEIGCCPLISQFRRVDSCIVDLMPVKMYPSKRPPPRPITTPLLRVAVQGSEIVVTAPGSDYVMTYHKPAELS